MKFVSIISMSILTLSIWGLFFTLFFVDLDPVYQVQPNVDEQRKLGAEVSGELSRFEQVEQDEASSLEAEQDEAEQLETVSNIATEEEPPSSLVERASSPYNDILYEFEKDSPVSVDELLGALDLN